MASVKFNDEPPVIPDNIVDLQEFTEKLWEQIFDADEEDKDKVKMYNQAAKSYNKMVGRPDLTTIQNFKQQKNQIMATKKAAAKKAAKKTAVKKAAPKKAAKKAAVKKAAPKKDGERKPTQKDQIVLLADQGMSVDQIVEKTGIQKANVQWYFSKLKLGKKSK